MNTWIIAVIVVGLLVVASVSVFALAGNSTAPATSAKTCTSCGGKCTATSNCGLASCGAVKGTGTCGCGK